MATQAQTMAVPPSAGMSRKAREAWMAYLFVSPWIILSIVFTFGAMLYVFYLSFTDIQLLNTPKVIGPANYSRVLGDKLFQTAVFNTVLYSVVVTFCQTSLALVLAVILNAKLRGKQFFRVAWYVPSITSSVVISLIFIWIFQKEGILNYLLATLFGWTGFQPVAWLTDASAHTALPAIMLLNILTTSPTFMLYFLAALQDIPEEVNEAASIDGCVGVQRFFRVTIPMMRPIIFLVVVLGTIGTLQIFDQVNIMTSGGPLNQTTTINFLIYNASWTNFDVAYASAAAVILFVMILVLYLIQQRLLGRSNTGA
jgi:multiple sugar transport system permease protein